MYNAGLILEGGAMRGVYTTGVTDFFLEKGIAFKECYAVSAGAGHACSYLSGQKGRAYAVNVNYLRDKRYSGIYPLLKTGELFGMDLIYDIIPNELYPLDYEAINKNESKMYAVVTNCRTGKAEYIKITDIYKQMNVIRASGSLPMFAHMVDIDGEKYLDGGVADSIPIKKSVENGNKKNVVVLTRDKTYRKSKTGFLRVIKAKYRDYPELVGAIENRYRVYNETLDYIEEQEKQGRVFVIRPQKPVEVKRAEKNLNKLSALRTDGYNDAKREYRALLEFLER